MRADHGKHTVSTYMKIELTCKQKRREKEKNKERYERLIVTNDYVELSLNIKVLLLNMRKKMK